MSAMIALILLATIPTAVAAEAATPQPPLQPVWMWRPTSPDMVKALPRRAKSNGSAILECLVSPKGTLEDCRIVEETPSGQGFGEATLKVAPKFRMRELDATGQPTAGRLYRLTIRWNLPSDADN